MVLDVPAERPVARRLEACIGKSGGCRPGQLQDGECRPEQAR